MIKQKVITAHNGVQMKEELETAISMGWIVQTMAVNPTGTWIAVLYREAV